MTIQAAKFWCMQRITAEEQRQRLPYEILRMMILSLVCGAFFLFRLLSPHHPGDHKSIHNQFGVSLFAVSFLSLVVYIILRMKSWQQ